jgi:hypothetical protein
LTSRSADGSTTSPTAFGPLSVTKLKKPGSSRRRSAAPKIWLPESQVDHYGEDPRKLDRRIRERLRGRTYDGALQPRMHARTGTAATRRQRQAAHRARQRAGVIALTIEVDA